MPFNPLTGRWEISSELWGGVGGDWGGVDEGTWAQGTMPSQSIVSEMAAEWLEDRTIQEDYARAMADLPPDPRYRRGFASMAPRLAGQYMLAQPYMGQEGAVGPSSFGQYLSDIGGGVPGYGATSLAQLQERAQMAADVAMQRESAGWGDLDPVRLAYEGTFGGGESEARANQMAVAQMLARQRPGGGVYRGQLGKQMGIGLERLAQRRMARGANPNSFLDWYLSQTTGA